MKLLRTLSGPLLALLLAAHPALAGTGATITPEDDWSPVPACVFGMPESGDAVRNDNTGFVTEVLRAALASAGYDLIHRDLPYRRACAELAKGRIQCTLTAKDTPTAAARARSVIAACDLSVAYVSARGFSGLRDLADQKVAHLYGFDFQQLLPVRIRPQPTYDRTSAIHMLDRGHVSYVIGEDTLLRDAVRKSGLPSTEFGFSRFMSMDVVPVFAPTAEGVRLRDIFDLRMREMARSGELAAIYSRHGLPEDRIRHILAADRD